METFGFDPAADWQARGLALRRGIYAFDVVWRGQVLCRVHLRVPGRHNVLNALAAKVVSGHHVATAADEMGGTTLAFDLWPGHPFEDEVRKLLATVRGQIWPLWERVAAYNKENRPDVTYKVTFYCGQHLAREDEGT